MNFFARRTRQGDSTRVIAAARESLSLLSAKDRVRYIGLVILQMCSSALDVIGVSLLALVGVMAASLVQGEASLPPIVQTALEKLGLSDVPPAKVVSTVAIIAGIFLLTKSALSAYLLRRGLTFLANRQAIISTNLAARLLSRPLVEIESRTSQKSAYAILQGVTASVVTLLGAVSIMLTEASLLTLFALTLFLVNPLITAIAFAFFFALAVIMQRVLGHWAARIGAQSAEATHHAQAAVQEAIVSYREIAVSDRRELYSDRIGSLIWRTAHSQADLALMSQVPKYVFEGAIAVGVLALGFVNWDSSTAPEIIGTMTFFLAAAMRILPSLLRLQTSALTMRSAAGASSATQELVHSLGFQPDGAQARRTPVEVLAARNDHQGFTPELQMTDVSATYPGASSPALADVSVHVVPGEYVALVGPTGAGKSTLADVALGVMPTTSGVVLVSGKTPSDAIHTWPGAIAYVPQSVSLVAGTIRQNVALGLPEELIDDGRVWEALERAHLADFLHSQRSGLETVVGERGVKLSGGQRQRVGLARALFTQPRLLILDEATSALDAETESAISQTLNFLAGQTTLLVIAHRLPSVRKATSVVYMEGGRILAQGSFETVRDAIPQFDHQAQLLGL